MTINNSIRSLQSYEKKEKKKKEIMDQLPELRAESISGEKLGPIIEVNKDDR